MVRTRGVVLKRGGPVMICPSCKGDVPMGADMAKALANHLVLFLRKPAP